MPFSALVDLNARVLDHRCIGGGSSNHATRAMESIIKALNLVVREQFDFFKGIIP